MLNRDLINLKTNTLNIAFNNIKSVNNENIIIIYVINVLLIKAKNFNNNYKVRDRIFVNNIISVFNFIFNYYENAFNANMK